MVTILLGLFWNGMVGAFYHCQTPISFSEFWNGRGTVICMWQQNGPSTTKQALRDEEIKHWRGRVAGKNCPRKHSMCLNATEPKIYFLAGPSQLCEYLACQAPMPEVLYDSTRGLRFIP